MTMGSVSRFTAAEQKQILDFVRDVISARLERKALPAIPNIPQLQEMGSCFVTLHLNGELRGCIGNIEAFEALGENLRSNACNAAFKDPRFKPLTEEEFKAVEVEVSLLTPSEPIASAEEFVPGEHGITFSLFGRRSVFLPQVPVEQNWDRETTLNYLALKAGFSTNAWKSADARFSVFKSEIIR